MSLEPVSELMRAARRGNYAVGYFESWNLESLQGVVDAAEALRAPVIIGFNGEFLSHAGRLVAERLSWYAQLGQAAAASLTVPCGLIFNECAQDDWLRRAGQLGFNLVMPADAAAPADQYRQRVASIVAASHPIGVEVEAELGALPHGQADPRQTLTQPDAAATFVAATDIDLLAVSTGNVHVMLQGRAALDLPHLARIAAAVSIPLVLHGGSGIADKSLRQAIGLGVAKVNYGTCLKQAYLRAVRAGLAAAAEDPHALLGIGGDHDLMVAGRTAVRAEVERRMAVLGCSGRA